MVLLQKNLRGIWCRVREVSSEKMTAVRPADLVRRMRLGKFVLLYRGIAAGTWITV